MMEQNVNSYKGYRTLIVITYLCMITFGLIETLKGAVIPSIRTEFLVDYTHIGQMLFVASLGYLIATFFGGMATEKYGLKKLFIFGVSIVILSTGLFSIMPSFYGVVATYFILGIGLGCFEVGVNALGAKIFTKNAAMMMNFMHLFFGVGATIAPKYAGAFIENNTSWKVAYLMTIVLTLILLIIILFVKFPETSIEHEDDKVSFRELAKSSKVWLIAIILGFFVMMEAGTANWLVNYLQEARNLDVVKSTTYLTWFFIIFTFGRLVGGYIADKIGYIKSLLYFTATATILLFAGIMLGQTFIILFSIMGFFISIMFPTMMALIMKEYSYGVGAVMGFTITVCGVFNMVGNWFVGKINDLWGVGVGLGSLGVGGIIACILLLALNKQAVACGLAQKKTI